MKNLSKMSGEQLLLARIFNSVPHKEITAELNRRRLATKTPKAAKAA